MYSCIHTSTKHTVYQSKQLFGYLYCTAYTVCTMLMHRLARSTHSSTPCARLWTLQVAGTGMLAAPGMLVACTRLRLCPPAPTPCLPNVVHQL